MIDTKTYVLDSRQISEENQKSTKNKSLHEIQNVISLSQFIQENIENPNLPMETKTSLLNSCEIKPGASVLILSEKGDSEKNKQDAKDTELINEKYNY